MAARAVVIGVLALFGVFVLHYVLSIILGVGSFLTDAFYNSIEQVAANTTGANVTAVEEARGMLDRAYGYLATGWQTAVIVTIVVLFLAMMADAMRRRPEEVY